MCSRTLPQIHLKDPRIHLAQVLIHTFFCRVYLFAYNVLHISDCEGGKSYVEYGYCPRDKAFPDELSVIRELSYNKLNAFDLDTHGQFFWNFRTEFEPRWDYQQAVFNGVNQLLY